MNPVMILPGPKHHGILKAVINQSGDLKQEGGCSCVAGKLSSTVMYVTTNRVTELYAHVGFAW